MSGDCIRKLIKILESQTINERHGVLLSIPGELDSAHKYLGCYYIHTHTLYDFRRNADFDLKSVVFNLGISGANCCMFATALNIMHT